MEDQASLFNNLEGIFVFSGIIAFILSHFLAPFVLSKYRKVLLKGMSSWTSTTPPPAEPVRPDSKPPVLLSWINYNETNTKGLNFERKNNRRLMTIYIMTSFVFGLIASFAFFDFKTEDGDIDITLIRISSFTIAFSMPGIFLAYQRLKNNVVSFFLFFIGVVVAHLTLLWVTGMYDGPIWEFSLLYLLGFIPILIFVSLTWRSKRGVAPFLFLFLSGVVPVISGWLVSSINIGEVILEVMGEVVFKSFVVFLAIMFVFAYLGVVWILFRWLSARYGNKKFSRWMFEADTLFAITTILIASSLLSVNKIAGVIGMVVAFIIYKILIYLFNKILIEKKEENQHDLLFLRVFGKQKQVSRLMNNFTFHWRALGPIYMIAAPDLAADNIDPIELFDFFTGNTKNRFVKDISDLHLQLSRLDKLPDPDGRYRVNEFFCYSNIWKQVFNSLLPHSHVVLMDLRGFTTENEGCLYEVGQLLNYVPLEKTVFLIDKATDIDFLKNRLLHIWENLTLASPNQSGEGKACFFQTQTGSRKEVDALKGLVYYLSNA